MNERAKLHGCLVILERAELSRTKHGNSRCWQLTGGYDHQIIRLTVYQETVNKIKLAGYDVSQWTQPTAVDVHIPVYLDWNEKNSRLEVGEVLAKEASYG